MNTNMKPILSFCGGAIIGALAGIFGTKYYMEKKFEQEIMDADERYMDFVKKNYSVPNSQEIFDDDEINPVIASEMPSEGPEKPQGATLTPEEITNRLNRNRDLTNYAAVYGQIHPEAEKKNKKPIQIDIPKIEEEPEDEDEEEEVPAEIEAYAEERKKNEGRKPRLISAKKVYELPDEVELRGLQFYIEDEVLADEDTEEEIDDVETLVGDCLQKYNFAESEERTIYVMNYDLDTCYEITKIDASYEETH